MSAQFTVRQMGCLILMQDIGALPPFYNVTSNILVEGLTLNGAHKHLQYHTLVKMAALRSCDSYKTMYNQLLKAG